MEKGSHYNLCISDLIMGLLFIFILVLLKFMLEFQSKKDDLSKPLVERGHIIKNIKKELEKEGIKSEIDVKNGVLKLSNVHYFDKGQYELSEKGRKDFEQIKKILFENITCYSHLNSQITKQQWPSGLENEGRLIEWQSHCSKTHKNKYGLIDSILIEGHADKTPISKTGSLSKIGVKTNLDLAVKRSIIAFQALSDYEEVSSDEKISAGNYLFALTNKKEKPLFGVTSFGNLRSHHNKKSRNPAQIEKDQGQDRRIDIRFVMGQPKNLKSISNLNKKKPKGPCEEKLNGR